MLPHRLLLLLALLPTSKAALSFASVFGDDQVFQRSAKAAVYGSGTPGLTVAVTVSDDRTGLVELVAPPVVVGSGGEWRALLPPHAAGTGFTVTASAGGSSISLRRTSFGDVWFCSGQSNMELGLYYTFTRNQSLAAVASGKYDNIRLLHFDHNPLKKPTYVTNGSIATSRENSSWLTPAAAMAAIKDGCHGPRCQSELDAFSATCWYFGESLTDRMVAEAEAEGSGGAAPVPIGLIESAFGGTCIESWLGQEEQLQCGNITCTSNQSWPFTTDTQAACAAVASPGNSAGSNAELYNGMVTPFVNMTLKGFLWCEYHAIVPHRQQARRQALTSCWCHHCRHRRRSSIAQTRARTTCHTSRATCWTRQAMRAYCLHSLQTGATYGRSSRAQHRPRLRLGSWSWPTRPMRVGGATSLRCIGRRLLTTALRPIVISLALS